MKPLHVGLLVIGAAVAGGLAVRMTEPPALPRPAATVPASSPRVQPVQPAVLKTAAAPQHVPAVPQQAMIVTSAGISAHAAVSAPPAISKPDNGIPAPPPVYSEPRHTSARPTPFPEIAKADPGLGPTPYKPPAIDPAAAPGAGQPPLYTQVEETQVERPQAPRRVTLEPGMTIAIRTLETLSSDRVSRGDVFSASLAEPLVIDGLIIAERGARVDGRVVNAIRPARMNGRSELRLALSSIRTADGQRVAISTEPWSKIGAGSGSAQAEEIGGGAILGAIIGAIAGGGKGAAIGAGIGSGAGVGAAVATKAKPVSVPGESVIRFRVNTRVTITERQL